MATENSSPGEMARALARRSGVNRAALRDAGRRVQQIFADDIVGVDDPLQDIRLSLDVTSGRWLVAAYGVYYRADSDVIRSLGGALPMQTLLECPEVEGQATVSVESEELIITCHGRVGDVTVELDRSELNVVAPISLTPQSQADSWVPTTFTLRAEHLRRIELHTYLPEAEGFGPKEYIVSTGRQIVTVGEIDRGVRGSISIEHLCEPGGTTFNVSLAYPESSPASELRRLGAIITGVSRVLPKSAFDA
jgi:hypothetical protein